MPATVTSTQTADSAAVAAALSRYPEFATARLLADDTGLSEPAVRRALTILVDSGAATRTPGTGRGKSRVPDTWTACPADNATTDNARDVAANSTDPDANADGATDQPDPADPPTDRDASTGPAVTDAGNATTEGAGRDRTDNHQPHTDTADSTDADTAASEPHASDAAMPATEPPTDTATDDTDTPVSDNETRDGNGIPAPVSPAPVGSADHIKVVMVAAILGDHPDGVTAADIVTESGLRAAIVGRVLVAMELAGAAVRITDPDSGTETWTRGKADLDTVDLSAVVSWKVCPECGHRTRMRAGVAVTRSVSTEPGRNADGQPTLAKNALRTLVAEFLTTHPGHEFTAGTIARELNRSSGAVGNALAKLVTASEAVLVKETPMTYSAPPADESATGDTDTAPTGTATTAA